MQQFETVEQLQDHIKNMMVNKGWIPSDIYIYGKYMVCIGVRRNVDELQEEVAIGIDEDSEKVEDQTDPLRHYETTHFYISILKYVPDYKPVYARGDKVREKELTKHKYKGKSI